MAILLLSQKKLSYFVELSELVWHAVLLRLESTVQIRMFRTKATADELIFSAKAPNINSERWPSG
jgi:hypothetical protein